jgi:DNA mismatch endonuclease, patch repair protein
LNRTKAQISEVMRRVHSRYTGPELRVCSTLRRLKLNFSSHRAELPGCPDFVFERQQLAIFVDGDFWHGRQWRLRGLPSLASQFKGCRNRGYWIKKIEGNILRDRANARRLRRMGWSVFRIWESDLKKHPEISLRRVVRALEGRR